jgi:hypothetical protein
MENYESNFKKQKKQQTKNPFRSVFICVLISLLFVSWWLNISRETLDKIQKNLYFQGI